MYIDHDSVGSLGTEHRVILLRGQINAIKEYIDLLMTQSAIVREQRCLLQYQQNIQPLATTEQLDFTCPETSFVNVLDIKSTQDFAVSGPSLWLKGTADFSASHPRSGSILTIPVVQPPTQPQGSTSKLGSISRRYKPGHCGFQRRFAQHEPPALFQGWVDVSRSIF